MQPVGGVLLTVLPGAQGWGSQASKTAQSLRRGREEAAVPCAIGGVTDTSGLSQ